jgi:hypothetical protein
MADYASVDRVEAEYEPLYQKYMLPRKTFAQQFSQLYRLRIATMRERMRYPLVCLCTGLSASVLY